MTIAEALRDAAASLREIAERPRLEAEILLAHHLGCERTSLLLREGETLPREEEFFALIERRKAHEPIEYITNEVSFYSETFYIASGALIPRPETELLVEEVAHLIREKGLKRIAEIGVGSGALSVTLARIFPELKIVATDISPEALSIAGVNAERFGVKDRIELRQSSLLDGVEAVEMIVSNPPYIPAGTELEPNVADYEPETALYAPGDGTDLLRQIVLLGQERGIPIACEMGYDQRAAMEGFFKEQGIEHYRFYKDLAGLDRGFLIND
ncbi:peptide chain release factor N(5)-glutamine methyltransferase [Nitratifractor salsuginis]|uniref:Release factor glutamine methyltransferase n=1 Tax=Nitratifractor salsuginis (strain DSM 16511 / JCM 12458 / E9I37-1) TaxID=749222 RepID=E6X083_NITSE|nr:peptide chain release factor N(5)-glutamine methyltransferase [Nitratifractor salsuginis]ADV45672.1 protein-(glutamine-N5) methyltransferase, release factor-specific [Nitratifractor salsuginis DSM 16511]